MRTLVAIIARKLVESSWQHLEIFAFALSTHLNVCSRSRVADRKLDSMRFGEGYEGGKAFR